MNCLPCFNKDDDEDADPQPPPSKNSAAIDAAKEAAASSSKAQTFNFRELAMATKNFRQECLLGEGGFGRVFRGKLQSSGQVVAVKQLDRNGMQGNKEFLVEMGSLENHLFGDDPDKKPMDWFTRMKIASGAANGLEYLHDKANPPIIYRDLKPSNILLDENYEPKLSDFGLAKLGAGGGKINPTSRVMGTYGYSAPEYSSGGELTLKSDIYSFGVVLLELLTGRKAIDTTRPNDEQNLVTWAQPIFREPKRFPDLADPRLNREFPVTSLNQAVGICAMCLQEEPSVRPLIGDVVAALSFLAIPQPITTPSPAPTENAYAPPSEQKMHYEPETNQNKPTQSVQDESRSSEDSESSESEDESISDRRIEGSSENSMEEKVGSSRYSGRESEHQDSDGRHSSDNSEEQSSYSSDSDSGGENTNYDDAETTELEDLEISVDSSANYSLYSAQSNDSSMKSDAGNKSSKHGSSRRSSPKKNTGSRRRKPVVTFKEPSLSTKKNGTRKPEGENSGSDNNNQTLPAATDGRQKQQEQQQQQEEQQQSSSSSSSESSSESEDEKKSPRHGKESSDADRYDNNHRVFDQSEKDVPKLRHLKTR
ncbi:hypothetical protein BVRB_4g076950 [Beta vulgaris subsp. vulgaris]|nr:hypothetical protein BVRB_4g076950 [Beta vulgaris subsp. vulgaris]